MCAGGELGKDSCQGDNALLNRFAIEIEERIYECIYFVVTISINIGDSGGPLMAYNEINRTRPFHYLVGVVSFGTTRCGREGWPGVYTVRIKASCIHELNKCFDFTFLS